MQGAVHRSVMVIVRRAFTTGAVALALLLAMPAQAQVQRTMLDTGFEEPDLRSGNATCFRHVPAQLVPGWNTTDATPVNGTHSTWCDGSPVVGWTSTSQSIEIWRNGMSGSGGRVVWARQGRQHAELNAYSNGRLSQNVCLLNGERITWSASHHGLYGTDVAEFRIGSLPIARMTDDYNGTGFVTLGAAGGTATRTAGPNNWGDYTGSFIYSGASGVVDLGFGAISAATNVLTGNHLDAVQVNLRPFVEFAEPAYQQNEAQPTLNIPQLVVAGTVPTGGMLVPITITGGTATLGVDYTTPGNSPNFTVFIPAGVYDGSFFSLPVTVIDDGFSDPNETITFSTPATGPADDYNLASLDSCGAAPQSTTTSTLVDAVSPLPRIQLNKALSADRIAVSDQFRLRIAGTNGTQTTTTGSGSTVGSGSIQVGPAAAGSVYTLSETMAAGSVSSLASYSPSIACTNTTPNSPTVLPNGAGSSFNVTPIAGDNISCTITNEVASQPAFLDIVKTVTSGQVYDNVGDIATYSYLVRNIGPTSVSALTVIDNKIASVSCPVTTLAAGASTTCTGSYTVTQADMDAAVVTNIATARATNTTGQVATDTDDAVINAAFPSLQLDKTTTTPSYTTVGQVLSYSYRVANDGNVAINAITVTDNRIATVNCPATSLVPGASMVCTATYTVTATDLDAGSVTNIATANGTPTAGSLAAARDSVTVTGPSAAPALTLDKNATAGFPYDSVGDVVTYSYLIRNTGNVTINTLSVVDDRIATVSCPVTALAAGASTTCTGSYTITQANLDAGSVTNNATANGNPIRGTLTPATDSVTVNATVTPALTLDKTIASGNPYDEVGDLIDYRYLVTNTGNVSISALSVLDNRIASVSCPVTVLAPNASTTCTATYTVTQADLDAGSITNNATASGTPTGGTLTPATDSATANAVLAPALTLDKTITGGDSYDAVGDVISYAYLVTNTGNATIAALSVTDDRIATVACPVTTLAPGASTTCTGTYTATQADLDAGAVTNNASASGTPSGGTLTPATDSETATSVAIPALSLAKDAVSGDPYDSVGDVVSYAYVVTNTGNVTISALSVTDNKIATVTCPVTTLAPGANTTCTGNYTVTQADLDAGSVTNLATANATPAVGTLTPDTDTETVRATANPAMSMAKTAVAGAPYDSVGDIISYQYVVTNTGNITIDELHVVDDRIATVNCPVTTLAPGASTTCTANYTVTQSDLDAGSVTNNAVATGSPPTLTPSTASETVNAAASPQLTLDKSAVAGAPYDAVGDVISYRYMVTNTGNVTISALGVTDNKIATVNCPVTTLAPGESVACNGTYAVSQADLDAGSVTNNASANGVPAQGTLAPATDNFTVSATATPSLTLDKRITSGNPYAAIGDVINYEYVVTNTGNVTISGLAVTDDRIATVSCPATTLAPGASTTCTASYATTQADQDTGEVVNHASASGTPAAGTLTPATDSERATSISTPALTLDKSAVSGAPYDSVGDVIGYQYLVHNASSVTISAISVTDDRIATVTCPVTTLAGGASTTCTATYVVTQADLDAGSVINNAFVSGTPARGTLVPDNDRETVNAVVSPSLTLDKTVASGSPYDAAGDVVGYQYLVTNTGNVTINALQVTDDRIATVTCPVAALAPGASTTCTASYTVTQADLDAGSVTNNASATGEPASGVLTPATDSATATVAAAPSLTLAKTAVAGNPFDAVGDVVTYQYVVTNTGNVTISALSVTDDRIATVSCPATTLAPGASTTCSATYTITQADLDAGSVTNNATASGAPAQGTLTPGTDSVTVNAAASPALTLDKTIASGNPYDSVGDVIAYAYLVSNTGNITINGLTVTDDHIATVTCPVTTLAPGASTTCTASYAATQADLDAGAVTNNATANGTPATGTLVPAGDSATATATIGAALTLDKTIVSGSPYDAVGDVVAYQYLVTNTGNVTISGLSVLDDRIATVNCPVTTLAPGASTTCTASYTITQADLDAGSVTNNATATGTPAQGSLTPATDTITATAASAPALTLEKTAATGAPYDAVGDVLGYDYRVTNTGNVTISALVVTDDRIANVICPVTTLAPGASTTCHADYFVTQVDLDAGSVTNNATATGTPATGTLATPPTDSVTVNAIATPALTLDKAAVAGQPYDSVGDVVSYEYRVTNTGNVTITALAVTDDKIATVACPVTTLAPGASTTCTASYTITQADLDAGSLTNNATASGTPAQGTLTPATDSVTVDATSAPALSLDKTVVSGAPYRAVGDVIAYAYAVINTGNVTITALTVTDDKIATVACPVTTLAPGASTTCTASYTVTQADLDAGSVTNIATANGTPASGTLTPVTDTVTVSAMPRVTYAKSVDTAGPVRAGEVVRYTLTTTVAYAPTTGALTLTDTLGSGLVFDGIASAGSYSCSSAGNTVTCTLPAGMVPGSYVVTYTAIVGANASGTVDNNVTASSVDAPACGASCRTSTPVAASLADVVKTSTPGDGATVEVGQTIAYTLTVTVANSATPSDLVLTDRPGAGLTIGAMPAGCAYDGTTIVCTLPAGTPVGVHTFTYAATVAANAGATVGNAVTVGNASGFGSPPTCSSCQTEHAVEATSLRVAKVAAVREVHIGDLVRYTLTVENVGAGVLTHGSVTDTPPAGFSYVEGSLRVADGDNQGTVEGQHPLRFGGLDIAPGQRATLTYLLRVGAGVRPGTHTNSAQAFSPNTGGPISNVATAQVELVADPLLDDSLIFGTVFNDCDGDGWQDDGEPGIPGVRIASVEGLLTETDQFGRYHLAGIPGGKWERGRNFILKVDPSTLPDGAQFTTDNPLVRRITPGVPVRFDWGVKRCVVEQKELQLGTVFFAPGSAEVRPLYDPVIATMAARINEYGGGEVVIDANGDSQALALERAMAVKQALEAKVTPQAARGLKVLARGNVDDPDSLVVGVDEGGALLGMVLFDTDQSTIRPEFAPLLDKVAAALERRRGGAVAIVGHTDTRGSHDYNTALGLRRAKAVYDALAQRLSPEVRSKVRVDASGDAAAPVDTKR